MFQGLFIVFSDKVVRKVTEKMIGKGVGWEDNRERRGMKEEEDVRLNKYCVQMIQSWWQNQEEISRIFQMNLEGRVIEWDWRGNVGKSKVLLVKKDKKVHIESVKMRRGEVEGVENLTI